MRIMSIHLVSQDIKKTPFTVNDAELVLFDSENHIAKSFRMD